MSDVYDLLQSAYDDLDDREKQKGSRLTKDELDAWVRYWSKKDSRIRPLLMSYATQVGSVGAVSQPSHDKSSGLGLLTSLAIVFGSFALFALWYFRPYSWITWAVSFAILIWVVCQAIVSYRARWNRLFLYTTGGSMMGGGVVAHYKLVVPLPFLHPDARFEIPDSSDYVSVAGIIAGLSTIYMGSKAK